jgi:hypothetical protein
MGVVYEQQQQQQQKYCGDVSCTNTNIIRSSSGISSGRGVSSTYTTSVDSNAFIRSRTSEVLTSDSKRYLEELGYVVVRRKQ